MYGPIHMFHMFTSLEKKKPEYKFYIYKVFFSITLF